MSLKLSREEWEQATGVRDEITRLTARIAELEADRDRTARTRDMWKGQCERQASTTLGLSDEHLSVHNKVEN